MSENEGYTSSCATDSSKSYDQQYPGQMAEKDNYGNAVYERYGQSYNGETSSGKDEYGNSKY
jgi:hypothetical protein